MILEFLRALLLAGVPVGAASYFLFSWALRRRSDRTVTSLKALEKDLKRESRERARQEKSRKRGVAAVLAEGAHFSRETQLDLIHNKWLAFGGGFYGLVGLITYAVVEFGELWAFAMQFGNVWVMITHLGLQTLIDLLVSAVRNFVVAIAWPAYWLSSIQSHYVWLWFVAAYLGYWGGARLAVKRSAAAFAGRTEGGDEQD